MASTTTGDLIEDEVFRHLFVSIAEEMGVTLERTAFSPNIKERRDHSCAIFDSDARLLAQAAHIPVHLGAFPRFMSAVAPRFDWSPGDVVICNDPYVGGTHLPDVSVLSPVWAGEQLAGFVANRAHHADIGGAFPGSMGLSTELCQEGFILPPVKLYSGGVLNDPLLQVFCRNVRTPEERLGDLRAQLAANATGIERFEQVLARYGLEDVRRRAEGARRNSQAAVGRLLETFPRGEFEFEDYLDSDGFGDPLPIRVRLWVEDGRFIIDFSGTAAQQKGSVNAPLAVTYSAVYYVLACLLPPGVSLNQGVFELVEVRAPAGSLVNASPPAAVAGGNVETSQRIVDAVLGALSHALPGRIPAASQGTMNNVTLGGATPAPWAYYETMGGGAGGLAGVAGASGIHCHMSNTRNTPVEALEYHYPLRVRRYALRDGSGGEGEAPGGDGLLREVELLQPATLTLLTDRRVLPPYGLEGGNAGLVGSNQVCRQSAWTEAPGKGSLSLEAGDRFRVATPGGGGWGEAS
ncbi:MAG: hydantoinase B/oxoprolinase family protein [Actinomycetota bacterium]